MMNENEIRHLTRRRFLEKAGLGAGSVALTALLHEQGILSASAPPQSPSMSETTFHRPRQVCNLVISDGQSFSGRHL